MKLGTAYYPDYFPAADWSRDLDRMKAAGIHCVRILEFGWCWYQPEPEKWSWEDLDRFLDLALKKRSLSASAPPRPRRLPGFSKDIPMPGS